MAAYAQIRHIELDKVGSGKKRITRPPGGESSDIFGDSPTTTPPSTPRKVKNHMASSIFTPEGSPVKTPTRNRPEDNSFNRLFGPKEGQGQTVPDAPPTPKKNHQKSSIVFQGDQKAVAVAAAAVPVTVAPTNGITNGNGHANGADSGPSSAGSSGTSSPIPMATGTNGHLHGGTGSTGSLSGPSSGSSTPCGSINGDYKPSNGHTNGAMPTTPSRRVPPGGYSSKLW